MERGKHGSRGSKSKTPVREDDTASKTDSPSTGSKPKVKATGQLGSKVETVKYPKGKATGSTLGSSSETVSAMKSPRCLCTVKGFPPAARVRENGAISYSFMDDGGGSWDFLGMEDQVLVQWHIYDGAADVVDNGKTTYSLPSFREIILDLEKHDYTFNEAQRDEDWGFQVKERGPIESPGRGRSPKRRSPAKRGVKRTHTEARPPSEARAPEVRSPSKRSAPVDKQRPVSPTLDMTDLETEVQPPSKRSAPAVHQLAEGVISDLVN
jgi:hypothetical protein